MERSFRTGPGRNAQEFSVQHASATSPGRPTAEDRTMTWTTSKQHPARGFQRLTCRLLMMLFLAIPTPLLGEVNTAEDPAQPEFLESVYCAVCHANARGATAMRDSRHQGISPYDLWATSSMAHSARDPYWCAAISRSRYRTHRPRRDRNQMHAVPCADGGCPTDSAQRAAAGSFADSNRRTDLRDGRRFLHGLPPASAGRTRR